MNIKQISIFLFTIIIISGCAQGLGKIKHNPSLKDSYRETINTDKYNYFYCGRPYAVVGIDKDYEFVGRGWYKLDSGEKVLDSIDHLTDTLQELGILHVADILDKDGEKKGLWYSYYRTSVVDINENLKTINVYNPYNPNEDDVTDAGE